MESQGHFRRRVSVRGAVLDDASILAIRLKRYDNAAVDVGNSWIIPGGGVDQGESIIEALRREMVEETGVEPVIGPLLYIQQFKDNGNEFLEFIFHITNTQDYKSIDLSATSHGEEEIAEIRFIDPRSSAILPRFLGQEELDRVDTQIAPKFFSYL